ncbi:T9SS type A sorting domain-containing protein [Hymenobacter cavernae]|uniref:Secretion system C-terminal sorting domain-containing protein n=1 Tax=Hymenobacter cavernae TaxID=2044852 RepID=A0ABQ1U8I4_9BACT|nr:T9SS type A sorting domain-containing protein [Hymenobacter cavernae]GGF11347.1 hypothetical protein GCM10011383_23200 [Hymenobacter cavernae]
MKQTYFGISTLASLALSLGSALPATAQYVFTDSNLAPYTQDFDAMTGDVPLTYGTTSIPSMVGVYAEAQADPQYGNGSFYPSKISANDGSNESGNYYHFGKAGETDRAFGGIAETGTYTGVGYAGIRLKNGTSKTIENLEIQYAMEQWYNSGNAAAAYVNVSYRKSSGVEGENFASLSSVAIGDPWTKVPELTVQAPSTGTVIDNRDGNSPANRRVVQTTLTGVNIAPGQEIMIRWDYILNPTTNGNGVSIDDLAIRPQTSTFFAQGGSISGLRSGNSGAQTFGTTSLVWQSTSGEAPANLNAPNQTYYIAGAVSAADLAGITGANSKVIIGTPAQTDKPAQPGLLLLDDNTGLNVPLDIADGSTLRIEDAAANTPVAFGTLAPSSTVVYAGATASHTIKPASYGKLTLEGSGPKALGGSVLVNGDLQLSNAKLKLGAFNATITKGSKVTGANANSYVIADNGGQLRQSVLSDNAEVVFPVGTATAYLPVTLQQSAPRSEDVFAVQVADSKFATYDANDTGIGSPVTETKSVRKTWFVSEEVKGDANLTLKMQWQNTDQTADFDPTQAFITHFRNGFWDRTATEVGAVPMTSASGTYALLRSNITSFSPFSVSSDMSQPLPVELISFNANRVGGVVNCTWATASEKNNDYFDLERSLNGQTFNVIGTVAGTGTSSATHSYSLQDRHPAAVTAYYRLRQVDRDGTSVYSPVVAVNGSAAAVSITAVPNPSNGPIVVTLSATEASTVRGTVTNMLGTEVLSFAKPVSAGLQYLTLDLSSQSAGVYLLRIQTLQGPQTLRVIKQ